MRSIKYTIIGIFIITLFTNSCGKDHWSDQYCYECIGTGLWTDFNNNSHHCYETQEECMEWVREHEPDGEVCIQCGD